MLIIIAKEILFNTHQFDDSRMGLTGNRWRRWPKTGQGGSDSSMADVPKGIQRPKQNKSISFTIAEKAL